MNRMFHFATDCCLPLEYIKTFFKKYYDRSIVKCTTKRGSFSTDLNKINVIIYSSSSLLTLS